MNITCPNCNALYQKIPEKYINHSLRCKKCNYRFKLSDSTPPKGTVRISAVNLSNETVAAQETKLAPQETQLIPPESLSNKTPPQETELAVFESLSEDQKSSRSTKKLQNQQSVISKIIGLGSEHFSVQKKNTQQSIHDWHIGDILLELYEVKKVLGEGQFGKVFQVRHRDWNFDLALKTPKQKALAAGYETIEKEAETWVNLGLHPHIVNCYYVRRIDGIPQIFSEYVDGGDLKALILSKNLYQKDDKKILLKILDIAIQFAWGLHYAHEQGLIHQDIKPANVMVTSNGIIKITDFGLAKAGIMANISGQSKNQTIVINGMGMTPAYASPEQLAGKSLTRRTDLWSWAVCVLEMLLGYCSWEAGSVAPGILEAYINNTLDDKPALASIPESLSLLLASCFCEAEDKRPVNSNDLAESLLVIYRDESGIEYPRQQPKEGSGTASSLNNQAISLLDLGKIEEALESWKNALNIEPKHFETNYNLLLYNWKNKGLDETELLSKVEFFTCKEPLEKNNTENKKAGRIDTALAKLYIQFGQYDNAIKIFNGNQEKLKQLPTKLSGEAYKTLGLALCAKYRLVKTMSKWMTVIECFKKILVNNESDPYLITAYTLALQRSGQKKQAAEFFRTSTATGIIPKQLNQAVTLFLPGYEVLYRISKKNITIARFINRGKRILFNQGHSLLLWQLKEKQIIREMKGHLSEITAFDISSDENIVISGSKQGNIRVWELTTGKLLNVWTAHKEKINALKISPCGQFVCSASDENILCLWDVHKQIKIKSFYGEGHNSGINDIQYSPSGNTIASGGADSILRIWNKISGHTNKILSGHEKMITCVQWLNDEQILSASEDKTIRLWDIITGQCLKIFSGHAGIINSLNIDVKKEFFLSGSSDGIVRFWSIKSGSSYIVSQFSDAVRYISMDDSALFSLLVTSEGMSIIETNNLFRYRVPYLFSLPESAVEIDQLSHEYQDRINQAELALSLHDNITALEEIEQARSIKGYERDYSAFKYWSGLYSTFPKLKLNDIWKFRDLPIHNKRITSLDISPFDNIIYSAAKDQFIYQWNIETQNSAKIFSQFDKEISIIKVTADGSGMLVACGENILVMDIQSGRQLSLFCHHSANVAAMIISADGRFALSSDAAGSLYLWRLLTGEIMADFTDKDNIVTAIAVTPDGRFAITGHRNNNSVSIWDMSSGTIISTLNEHENIVTSIAVTSDGRYIVSASADASLRLWQVQSSRKKSIRIMRGHTKRINQVAIDYQNKLAFSTSEDRSIRIWDINNGKCLHSFENINSAYTTACITMDGQYAVSGNTKGMISIWCLDWLLSKKNYHEWDSGATIYLKNYLSTHKIAEPHKELKTILRILKYAGYGWLDKNEVGLKLTELYQSNISSVLPASKLNRSSVSRRKKYTRKSIIIYSVLCIIFVFTLLTFTQKDDSQEKLTSKNIKTIEITDADEQLTVDKMLNIAVLLSRLNHETIIYNGRLDTRSLIIPANIHELKKMLHVSNTELIDSWGQEFIYQGVKSGVFQGRIILRSAGSDHKFKTDDDLLLNGFPHWNSLQIRKNNQEIISLSSYREELQGKTVNQIYENEDNNLNESIENNSSLEEKEPAMDENDLIDEDDYEKNGYKVKLKQKIIIE